MGGIPQQADLALAIICARGEVVKQCPYVCFFHQGDDLTHGFAPSIEAGEHFALGARLDPGAVVVPFAVGFGVVTDYVDYFAVFDYCGEHVAMMAQVWGFDSVIYVFRRDFGVCVTGEEVIVSGWVLEIY